CAIRLQKPAGNASRPATSRLDHSIAGHDIGIEATRRGTVWMDNIASWIWVLIPLAAISIAPFKMWLRIKEKQIVAQTSLPAEKSAQYAQHMERFEARLRVLEQIVTDRGAETASQIEALRDRARIPVEDKTQ